MIRNLNLSKLFAALLLTTGVATCCVGQEVPDVDVAAIPVESLLDEAGTAALKEISEQFSAAAKETGQEKLQGMQEVFRSLERLAAASPNLAPARTLWSKLLISGSDIKTARATLQQSIAEYPDDPEAYVILAQLAVASGQLAECDAMCDFGEERILRWGDEHPRRIPLLSQVASARATVAQSRSVLTTQLRQIGIAKSYDEKAIGHLRDWVKLAPNDAAPHERLAAELIKHGDVAGAEKEFELARSLKPELPPTDLRVAKTLLERGQTDDGVARIERAIARHPDDLESVVMAADLLLAIGEVESARRQIDAALALDADDMSAKRLRGQILRFEGRWEDAVAVLQELNVSHPTDFETANLLALTLTELDDIEQRRRAVQVATVTAQRFSNATAFGVRSRVTLTWAAFRAGQVDVARKAVSQLLASGIQPKLLSGDEAYFLARLCVEFSRPDLATPILDHALARVTQFPKRGDAAALLESVSP